MTWGRLAASAFSVKSPFLGGGFASAFRPSQDPQGSLAKQHGFENK